MLLRTFPQIKGIGILLANEIVISVDNVVSDTTPLPERRLRVLQPYVAHLTLDVPPPAQQKNIIDRMTAKTQQISVARQQRKNQKNAEKQMEKAQKEARKDEKHHRRHSPTNTFQSSQQGYYESSQSYREADSYSDDSSIASIEHEIMHLNMKAAQLHVPAGHKSEIKLEKLAEEKAKLLGKLDKKKRKHQSKRIPGRMEGPYDYGAQPGDGGQTEGLMKHSEDGMQPGNVPHADHKQQEKETSQLESLRWLVVQNLQNH